MWQTWPPHQLNYITAAQNVIQGLSAVVAQTSGFWSMDLDTCARRCKEKTPSNKYFALRLYERKGWNVGDLVQCFCSVQDVTPATLTASEDCYQCNTGNMAMRCFILLLACGFCEPGVCVLLTLPWPVPICGQNATWPEGAFVSLLGKACGVLYSERKPEVCADMYVL